MYLAQRISPCTSKESRKRRMQEARLAKSQRRVTLTPATGHSSLVTASHTRLLDLSQSCGTCGREASESRLVHLLKSLGLVAASRLGWNHVVTERRLHQFKQSCVNLRSPSTRRSCPDASTTVWSRLSVRPDETRKTNSSSQTACRAAPAESNDERLWKTPHTKATSGCRRELLPPKTIAHHNDDGHDAENVHTSTARPCARSRRCFRRAAVNHSALLVQNNVQITSQLGHQF